MLETPAARTSHQIAEEAGCTYRQLDWWTRNEIIEPSIATANGSGSVRRWSDTDLVIVRVITC
jgi:DNA-binding transcriptional MerR regulator